MLLDYVLLPYFDASGMLYLKSSEGEKRHGKKTRDGNHQGFNPEGIFETQVCFLMSVLCPKKFNN